MALFSSNPSSFLGVDLGIGSIKLVELKKESGRARLVTYAFTEQLVDVMASDLEEHKKEIAELLKKICAKAKTTTTIAITALPSSEIFNAIISLSNVDKKTLASPKDLRPIIEREAEKITPLPIGEMVLDWKIIDSKVQESGPTKNVRLLLTGAAKALIKKYLDIFKLANLNLLSLETESFALIRSLVGNDKSIITLVDIGVAKTNVTIVDQGIPFLTRSINVGGRQISQVISDNLKISLDQAEQIKSDIGLVLTKGAEKDRGAELIEKVLAPIISEIKYCFELYQNQNSAEVKEIDKVVLGGGSALMPNLAEYLANILNLRVYVGDPWARVVYPKELRPVLEEIGPRFAVAVGLAMREIE